MNDLNINYQVLLDQFRSQFAELTSENDIVVGDERYIESVRLLPNQFGIVVHFESADLFQDQVEMPIIIECFGSKNEIDLTQDLLTKFAIRFNNTNFGVANIKQFYNSPRVSEPIVEYDNYYRSKWIIDGSLRFSSNAVEPKFLYYNAELNKYEQIDSIQHRLSIHNMAKPVATGNSKARNESILQSQSITFTLTTHFVKNQLILDCLKYNLDLDESFNHPFKFIITFTDNYMIERDFRLSDIDDSGVIGKNDTITLVFVM